MDTLFAITFHMLLQMEMLKVPDYVSVSRLSDLTRSDHVAFWNVNLSAIFLTDTGKCQSLHLKNNKKKICLSLSRLSLWLSVSSVCLPVSSACVSVSVRFV